MVSLRALKSVPPWSAAIAPVRTGSDSSKISNSCASDDMSHIRFRARNLFFWDILGHFWDILRHSLLKERNPHRRRIRSGLRFANVLAREARRELTAEEDLPQRPQRTLNNPSAPSAFSAVNSNDSILKYPLRTLTYSNTKLMKAVIKMDRPLGPLNS